jgi:hypothetical protein
VKPIKEETDIKVEVNNESDYDDNYVDTGTGVYLSNLEVNIQSTSSRSLCELWKEICSGFLCGLESDQVIRQRTKVTDIAHY